MLRFVGLRAWHERRVLAGVVALVTLASTLLGVTALLPQDVGPRAFLQAVRTSPPGELDTTAYVVDVPAGELARALRAARTVLDDTLGDLDPELSGLATSRPRDLGEGRTATLASGDLRRLATLVTGAVPTDGPGRSDGVLEALAPVGAAATLGLGVGDRLALGDETGLDGSDRPVTVVVTGTYRPTADPLWAAGPAPFLVTDDALAASGSGVSGLRVRATPRAGALGEETIAAAERSLADATAVLGRAVADAADIARVSSRLPGTVDDLRRQQQAVGYAALVVSVLAVALAVTAAVLAGSLVGDARRTGHRLLTARGASRAQQAGIAALEAVGVALVATLVAVPLSVAVVAGLSPQPGPTVTGLLVLEVAAASLLLAAGVSGLGALPPPDARGRAHPRVRWATDVVLVAVAVAGWFQLRAGATAGRGPGDVVLVVAPVVCVLALVVVGVRVLPPLLARVAAVVARRPGLGVVPVRAAADRVRSGTALVLLTGSLAAAVLGVALQSTWARSRVDQADLALGTGTALMLTVPPTARLGAEVRAVAPLRPVASRPVALGRFVGRPGDAPQLLAAAGADDRLAPSTPAAGIPLPAGGSGVRLQGRAATTTTATVRGVVQGAGGLRTVLDLGTVPLDGRPHGLARGSDVLDGLSLVALDVTFEGDVAATGAPAETTVTLEVPGPEGPVDGTWEARATDDLGPVSAPAVDVVRRSGATVLRARATVDPTALAYDDGSLLLTGFDAGAPVPAVVSRRLAGTVGVATGGELAAVVDGTAVVLRVVSLVDEVPSLPGRLAVLTDSDALSRALVGAGRLEPVVDAWWGDPVAPVEARALRALDVGTVTTRADARRAALAGPLQLALPAACRMLVGAGLLLLAAGAWLTVSVRPARRSRQVAHLRAMGLTRRRTARLLLVEHLAVLVPPVVVGVAVGGVASLLLAARLVRSDTGGAPLPPAVVIWPWLHQVAVLVVALAAVAAVAAGAASRQARTRALTATEDDG